MSRNYNILYKNYIKNSNNKTNLDLSEIDSIVNHSADSIFCSCLNYINKTNFTSTINILLEKIKPAGQLHIQCINIKKYMNDFLNKKISGEDFISKIKNIQSILSTEDFYILIDTKYFKLIQIDAVDDVLSITVQRIGI